MKTVATIVAAGLLLTGCTTSNPFTGESQLSKTSIGVGAGALLGAATGVSVTRVGDDIVLNMPGNITFASESAAINPAFTEVLGSVALVLNEYKQTLIDVNGHTDSTGTFALNQQLSQQRARSVADYLVSLQVNPQRVAVQGFADTQPIAPNNTEAGKAQNRRVEIRLVPIS